jgi:NAD(P)H-dependent FMN reductase
LKVIAILGSPRRHGGGYKVVQNLEGKLKGLGPVEMEYVQLSDLDLLPCKGCFTCISKGESHCPLKDGREGLERRMLEADGLILVSPGYVQNVSGLFKNFMDRFAYTNHRPRFFHQSTLVVANGGAGLKHAVRALSIALGGARITYRLQVAIPPWPIDQKMQAKNEREIERAAQALYRDMTTKGPSPRPDLQEYMRFRFFAKVAPGLSEYLPADFEFYHGKKDFYYETKISMGKKLAAAILIPLGLFMARGMAPAPQGKNMDK